MRNAERIPVVLEAIRKLWEKYPDLRLGQLMLDAAPSLPSSSLFNMEDDALVQRLYEVHAPGESPPKVSVFPEGGTPEGFASRR